MVSLSIFLTSLLIAFFPQVNSTTQYLQETQFLITHNRQDLVEQTLEKYRHQVRDFNESPEQLSELINLYGPLTNPNAKRAVRASIIEVEQRASDKGAACQFLDQVSVEPDINQAEQVILKQKADACSLNVLK